MEQVKRFLKLISGIKQNTIWFRSQERKDDREVLLKMLPQHSIGTEIGVRKGDFSGKIVDLLKPIKLHLIDPWKYEDSETYSNALYGGKAKGGQTGLDAQYEEVLGRFKHLIDSGTVEVHRGTSEEVAQSFPDEYFDWVYIDGNHLYEYVKKDLEIYYRKIKVGGYLAGDDYTDGNWWKGGVKKAVDEFVESQNIQMIEIKGAQFILKKVEK